MKKALMIAIGLALVALVGAGCKKQEQSGQMPAKPVDTAQTAPMVEPAAAVYYCPMDTDVVSDKPGKCPKCGMDLIPKTAETK